jgi:putative transposase
MKAIGPMQSGLVMQPLLASPSVLGRPRPTDMRTGTNAILYIYIASPVANGGSCPRTSPPCSTVKGYFYAWSRDGIFASLNYTLVMAAHEAAGRGERDWQPSVKTKESG